MPSPSSGRWAGVIASVALIALAVPASPASALKLTVRAQQLGTSESQMTLTSLPRRPGRCTATVRAARAAPLFLPTLVTHRGRAAWRWTIPAGAPSGAWTIRGVCTVRGRASRARTIVFISGRAFTEAAGFMFPGSLSVPVGRLLHSSRSQAIPIDTTGSKGGAGDGNPGEAGYCTWGAWNRAPWLGSAVYGPPRQNDAKWWADNAARNGLPTGTEPRVGAVFVKTTGTYGHVGVVTQVINATTFMAEEMNGGQLLAGSAGAAGKTTEFGRYAFHQHTTENIKFIYKPGTQPGAYIGHIVQWDGDTKSQKTAWLVGQDGRRRWIPTSEIYWCLKGKGIPGPDVLPAARLDEYPDLNGTWTNCGPNGYGAGTGDPPQETQPATTTTTTTQTTPPPGATTTTTQTAPPPPPPQTWRETTGGATNTWTNYTNAGGTQGPTIPAYTTVDIACKLQGFRVADGNTWWYRIAQSPWNAQYYASADAFYNNGQTSGSLHGTPFVDPAVRDC